MASRNALAPAICSSTGFMPYAELSEHIAIVSNYFADRRVPRHSVVFPNFTNPDLRQIVILAAMNCGLVPFIVSSIHELSEQPSFDLVIGGPDPIDPSLVPDLVIDDAVLNGKLADKTPRIFPARENEELCFIGSTTGTTGNRKMVGNTIGMVNRRGKIAREHHFEEAERVMVTLGSATAYSFITACRVLQSKACFVRSHPQPFPCLKMINAFCVDKLLTTPAAIDLFMDCMESHSIKCPSVRNIILTGSLFRKQLIARIESFFDARIHVVYGTSETGGIATGQVTSADYVSGYVGEINPGIQLVYDGSKGEEPAELLFLNEARLLSGYFSNGNLIPNEEPFYRLPDLGFVRGNQLFITGRDDEVYNFSGNKVAFNQIENHLLKKPEIKDVGIVSTASEVDPLGLIIVLVTTNPVDLAFLRDEICKTMKIELAKKHLQFVVLDKVPRNEMGKLDRKAVRASANQL